MIEEIIYHIAPAEAWVAVARVGEYRADSLATEGFIHCSTRAQVLATAGRYYRGARGLVLLEIDAARVIPEIRYELATNGDHFPHIYGPLNTEAVLQVWPFEPGAEGWFSWPPGFEERG